MILLFLLITIIGTIILLLISVSWRKQEVEIRHFQISADSIFQKLKKQIRVSDFRVDEIDEANRRLILSTGFSFLGGSWGEITEVVVTAEETGSQVYVRSEPKVSSNIGARGKVKRNVKRIFEMLEAEGVGEKAQVISLCPQCEKEMSEEFKVCPYCGFNLKFLCPSCNREVSIDYKLCPYCGTKLK